MLSVKSSGALCEVNTEMNLPLRISDQYLTIGGRNQTLAYTCKPSRNQGSKVRNREQNQC